MAAGFFFEMFPTIPLIHAFPLPFFRSLSVFGRRSFCVNKSIPQFELLKITVLKCIEFDAVVLPCSSVNESTAVSDMLGILQENIPKADCFQTLLRIHTALTKNGYIS